MHSESMQGSKGSKNRHHHHSTAFLHPNHALHNLHRNRLVRLFLFKEQTEINSKIKLMGGL